MNLNPEESVGAGAQCKTLLWNVEGLASLMQLGLEKELYEFDSILLTETFRTDNSKINGFYIFESLAVKADSGRGRPSLGLLVGVKSYLSPSLAYRSKYCVGVKTRCRNLICAYFPPNLDLDVTIQEISEAMSNLDLNLPTFVGGDFNARFDICNEKYEFLAETLSDFGLYVVNSPNQFTYLAPNGRSTIDLFFSNRKKVTCEAHPGDISTLRKHLPMVLLDELGYNPAGEVPSKIRRKRLIDADLLEKRDIMNIEFSLA